MTCADFEHLLTDYVLEDPSLDPPASARCEAHVRLCAKCRRSHAEVRRLARLIREDCELVKTAADGVARGAGDPEALRIRAAVSWKRLRTRMEGNNTRWSARAIRRLSTWRGLGKVSAAASCLTLAVLFPCRIWGALISRIQT